MATRVYKYGLMPIGYPPREAVDELWRTTPSFAATQLGVWLTPLASYDQSIALAQSVRVRLSRPAHP